MICTSLKKIRKRAPCKDGWEKLLAHLGKTKADDEPLPFFVIVESNGLKMRCGHVEQRQNMTTNGVCLQSGAQSKYNI